MTDINLDTRRTGQSRPAAETVDDDMPADTVELIELLFFAYRDFVSDPDQILDEYGFGRAHHRVIHFVGRNPGMHVAELLDILRITKQSLSRVLRELLDKGFVFQQEGARDRRQRLLFLTPEGKELHRRLITPQIERIESALLACDAETADQFRQALFQMIDADDRSHVMGLVDKGSEGS